LPVILNRHDGPPAYRPLPRWRHSLSARLIGWMARANLEMHDAAPGWIDPVVLRGLREAPV